LPLFALLFVVGGGRELEVRPAGELKNVSVGVEGRGREGEKGKYRFEAPW